MLKGCHWKALIYWNFNLSASTWVLGIPLNKFAPEKPGKKRVSLVGKTILPTTKSAGAIPLGNNIGQKGEEGHFGIIALSMPNHSGN